MFRSWVVLMRFLIFPSLTVGQSHFRFFEPVNPPRTVQIISHRGMKEIAPENTLPALQACINDFIEWVEVDIRLTKDGKHILLHDERLERTTNGNGSCSEVTLQELQSLDAGSWFAPRFKNTRLPSLVETFRACKGKVNLYLDCKKVDPELLVKEILDSSMESQVVVHGDSTLIRKVNGLSKGRIPVMTKYHSKMDFEAFVKEINLAAVEIDADEMSPELSKRFHAQGIQVQAKVLGKEWDKPEIWDKVIHAGADWLQTADPVGLSIFLTRKKIPKFPVGIAYHRGANRYAPENTIAAIQKSVAWGADYVEIDIRTTKDGLLLLLHDGKIDRTTKGKGAISDGLFSDLRKLDAGSWFGKPFEGSKLPTLDEALVTIGDKTAVYLDAKNISPELLAKKIREYRLFDRHVVYQSVDFLTKLKEVEPQVRALPPLKKLDDLDRVRKLKPYGVDASWSSLSKEMIDRCHEKGILVFSDALGLNETIDQYQKAIDWGIDVIQTDYPLRLIRAIETRKIIPKK